MGIGGMRVWTAIAAKGGEGHERGGSMVVRVGAMHLVAPPSLCLFCPPMLYSGCPGLLDLYAEPRKCLGEIIIPEGNTRATTAPGKDAMHRHHPPAVRSRWRFFLLQAILPSYEAAHALQPLYYR